MDWVKECDAIMREHGAVTAQRSYVRRHQARWRAQYLIRLMVELRLHERWELVEHTERKDGGWTWTVEYLRRHNGR